MKKIRPTILAFVLPLILSGCSFERPKPPLDLNKINWSLEAQLAVGEAQKVFEDAKNKAVDLTAGPCLSNSLFGNPDYPETMWVLDIAHSPRTDADNQLQNQCSAYAEGQAKNFIEMDAAGKVLRIYSPLIKSTD